MSFSKILTLVLLFFTVSFSVVEAKPQEMANQPASNSEVLTFSPKPVPLLVHTNKKTKEEPFAFNPNTFFEFLSQHSNNFLNPSLLNNALLTFQNFIKSLSNSFKLFYQKVQYFWIFIGFFTLSVMLARFMRFFALRHFKAIKLALPISYLNRVGLIIGDFILSGVVPAMVFLFAFFIFKNSNLGLKNNDFFLLLQFSVQLIFVFFLIISFTRNIFSPLFEPKRLLLLRDENAKKLDFYLTGLLTFFLIDLGLLAFIHKNTKFLPVSDISTPLFNLCKAYFIWKISNPILWKNGRLVSKERKNFWIGITFSVRLLIICVIGATLFGYHVFGSFAINRLTLVGFVWAFLMFVYLTIKEFLIFLLKRNFHPKSDKEIPQITLLIQAILIPALILFGIYILFPFFGLPREIYMHFLKALFTGFQLGEIKISLTAILLSILTFIICSQLVKSFQSLLKKHVFVYTDLDSGVQNSVVSGIGYIGVAITFLLSISVLGVSFKSLTVIIGALSVGIGFGLQNIVNNFMSGLIILIERPLKVGDWVIVNGNEGIVKKINIRSTELETFNKATLIIPNSEILTNPLTNWTHQNLNARIIVKVSVAYGSNVEQVKELLLKAASEDDRILKTPAPYVVFSNFGNDGLDFELRCVLSFLMEQLSVGTQLRERIYTFFNEEGISIPFPQRVLHLDTKESLKIVTQETETSSNPELKKEDFLKEKREKITLHLSKKGQD
ncbi:MAG: mechanosensitive ion channel [Alphaproteobacteria bacterium]|nr:mechanosensitive ion channel [Alphaproteobacteria bacterium]